jgi:pSer/pThr/pTyr-binding forkhead associated (FHA) protein
LIVEHVDGCGVPKADEPMQVSLELSGHPKANVQRVVLTDTTLVGRSRVCGLQIASSTVSRKHCEIRLNADSVSVLDLGSSNGTFVNSERLPAGEERTLQPGCRLNIGGVRFLVQYEPARSDEAALSAPAPVVAAVAASDALEEPLSADELLTAGDELFADEPLPADEPAAVETLDAEEPVASDAPVLNEADEPLSAEELPAAEPAPDLIFDDEPDLDALFADSPASGAGGDNATAPADAIDDDEPILEADEDQAFAFLTDDESAAAAPKRSDDSEIRDVLSQH